MTSFIGLIFGFLSIYFLAAIFVPKKVLFFISDEEQRKRWIGIVGLFLSYLFTFALLSNTDEYKVEQKNKAEIERSKTPGTEEWYQLRILAARNDSVRFAGLKTDTIKFDKMDLAHLIAFATVHKNYSKPDSIELQNETLANLYAFNQSQCQRIFKSCELKMRKRFAKVCSELMWEDDIDVKVTGKNADVLWLTGGLFAANRNKKKAQDTLSDALHLLNFKRVCYKWYELDDNYTYWDIE